MQRRIGQAEERAKQAHARAEQAEGRAEQVEKQVEMMAAELAEVKQAKEARRQRMTLEQHRSRLFECESDIRSQLKAEQGAGALAKNIARRWVLHHRMRATLAPENLSTRQNDLSFRESAVQELIGVQGTYTTKLGQLI